MEKLRQFRRVLLCSLALAMISACGGGSSSSGVGKSVGTAFAGRYAGFGEVTFATPGRVPQAYPIVVIIVINPDNTVVLDPETPLPGTGTITGNVVAAGYSAAIGNSPGVSCTGFIGVNGAVAGQTIVGNIGPSTYFCNGTPFTVQGAFAASKVPVAPSPGPTFRSQGTTLGAVVNTSVRVRSLTPRSSR